ncbi:MAG: hypothetical protein J6B71_09355 [Clostridia bacterium]|nr:hypothetical protein [Clostridia bacterium]
MKKLLAALLTVAMLIGAFAILPSAAEDEFAAYTKIATEADLLEFIEDVGADGEGDLYYVLTADITMTAAWTNIDWFAGVLDGNGHKITLTQPLTAPMFNDIDTAAIIKNLTIDGINRTGTADGVYGFCRKNDGNVWDVNFTNVKLVSPAKDVGLIDKNYGTLSRINATVDIQGKGDRAAGLAVRNEGTIRYSNMFGTVKSNYHVGGFTSDAKNGIFEGCVNYATVIATCSRAAGIAATCREDTKFINCINYGNLYAWRSNDANKKYDTKISGMGCWNNKNDGGVQAENCLNVGLLIGNDTSTCIGAMSAETNVGSNAPGSAVTTFTNCYTLEGVIQKFTNTNHTASDFDYTAYTPYTDIGTDAAIPAFSGTAVSADVLKSAEMITKLGSAFQLNTGADKDQYPIILVADTTPSPAPEIESDDPPADTEPVTDPVTEPVTEPETDPKTETTTKAPTASDNTESGCASVVGFASVGLIALAAVAPVVLRKKKED